MPDPAASTRSPRPDDSLTSPAWANLTGHEPTPDLHNAVTANTPATGGEPTDTDFGLGVGRAVGKYQILKRLGSGGNGQVYAARHTELGKTVALKFFKGYVAAKPQLDAMRREAQTLAALRHPGIVSVDDFSVHEMPRAEAGSAAGSPSIPIPFIVMEYVPSEQTLGAWNKAASPDVPEILRIGAELCDAVEHAHERGIIHRDLKPGNVLIEPGPDNRPHPRVIDFGLSQLLAGYGHAHHTGRGEFDRVTGTLQYMSPEQLAGNPLLVDHRSDVYALGVVLYELLCGRLPYNVSVRLTGELTHEIREGRPIPPSSIRPELKGAIEDVLMRALQKDPLKRHQRAGDLADDLRSILADRPVAWREEPVVERASRTARALTRRSRAVIAVAAAAFAMLAAVCLWVYGGLWRPMTAGYESLANVVGGPTITSIDNVRLIELRDGLDIGALAASLGVEGVNKDEMRSIRRLHGRLMERLAGARPRVVVFDMYFPQESSHDAAFNQGVEALNKAGIDAVVGAKVVRLDTPDASGAAGALSSGPAIAPTIRAGGARWGYIHVNAPKGRPLTVPLVTRQPDRGYFPSLAMAALVASRYPRARADYEAMEVPSDRSAFEGETATLFVRCYPEIATGAAATTPTAQWRFPISAIGPWENHTAYGFSENDLAAFWTTPYPPRAALEASARGYADVLALSDADLRAWAHDKIIVVADARAGVDRGDFGPYTDAPNAYNHVAAIDSLCKDVSLRYPAIKSVLLLAGAGALLGAFLGFVLSRSTFVQVAAGIICALLITGTALLLYAVAGIVANPFVLVAALLIAMALTAGLARLASRGSGALPSRVSA